MMQDAKRSAALNPEWEKAGKVHDWRNHVPENIRQLWPTYNIEQRVALVEWAEALANAEEWE